MDFWRRLTPTTKIIAGIGGLAVLYLGYRWYKGRQSAATGAGSGAGTVLQPTAGPAPTSPPTASVQLPGGASYSGPAAGLGTALSLIQPPSTAPSGPTGVGTQSGAGYAASGGPGTAVTTAGGTYYQLPPTGNLPAGSTTYYQAAPGVFEPYWTPQGNVQPLPAGTPLFVQQPTA